MNNGTQSALQIGQIWWETWYSW